MTKRTSLVLRDGQDQAITEIRKQSVSSDRYPELSRSEVLRRLIDEGLKQSDLGDLIGEATEVRYRRERYKEDKGWLINMRAGFRARIADQFKTRFKKGWSKDELRQYRRNMVEDAHLIFAGPEHSEDRERMIEYIDQVVEAATEAVEVSDRNPLDPDSLFEQFTGVAEGEVRETVETTRDSELFEEVVKDAIARIEATATTRDDDALADALATAHNVEDSIAEEAVAVARKRTATPGGVSGD